MTKYSLWITIYINVDHLGVDCDEVFPGILLGNGATVKKKARIYN
jgi:hypothetical protein